QDLRFRGKSRGLFREYFAMHQPLSRRLVRALLVPLCALATVPLATVSWATTAPDAATLTLTPDVAPPTTTVTASGTGVSAGERVALRFDQTNLGGAVANGSGTFTKNVAIPASAKP